MFTAIQNWEHQMGIVFCLMSNVIVLYRTSTTVILTRRRTNSHPWPFQQTWYNTYRTPRMSVWYWVLLLFKHLFNKKKIKKYINNKHTWYNTYRTQRMSVWFWVLLFVKKRKEKKWKFTSTSRHWYNTEVQERQSGTEFFYLFKNLFKKK